MPEKGYELLFTIRKKSGGTGRLSRQQIASETQVTLSLTIASEGARSSRSRNSTDEDCKDVPKDAGLYRSSQCFICSRIYFDQSLSKCPRCNSDSLQHYTTADLNYFARDRIPDSLAAGPVIQGKQ